MKKVYLLILSVVTLPSAHVMRSTAQQMPPALVVTEPVKTMKFHDQLTLVGRTEARAESRIVSEVSGRVTTIHAREGVWVSQAQPIVSIDSDRIRYSLEAKEAEAAQAKAQAELAQKELARAEDLFKKDILPQRTLDQAHANASSAVERYKQLEAERQKLKLDLESCTIRAPYHGYTVRQLVHVGEWVNPGSPVYEMVDLRDVKVTLDLPERYYRQLSIGGSVAIRISGDEANPAYGKVTGVAPRAGEATHTFPVIVTVPNGDGRLGGGMLVRATVSLDNVFSSLAVSKDAIVRQGTETMVYTIRDGKAMPIAVKTLSSNQTMVAIQGDGLAEGMPVVVRGNERIFPGSPVRVSEGSLEPARGTSGTPASPGSNL